MLLQKVPLKKRLLHRFKVPSPWFLLEEQIDFPQMKPPIWKDAHQDSGGSRAEVPNLPDTVALNAAPHVVVTPSHNTIFIAPP